MMKKYLITNFKKINFKKKSNIIFENEYLKNLYNDDQLSNYKCLSIENLNEDYKKKSNYIFCRKKVQRYLKDLVPILNELNNSKFEKFQWEILIEYFLIISIMNIKTRLDTLKKIKDKKNTYVHVNDYNLFFENTSVFKIYQFENENFNSYLNFLIAKKLKFKILKSKKKKAIFIFERLKKKPLLKKCIYFLYDKFLSFLKPIMIFDGYFGKKFS